MHKHTVLLLQAECFSSYHTEDTSGWLTLTNMQSSLTQAGNGFIFIETVLTIFISICIPLYSIASVRVIMTSYNDIITGQNAASSYVIIDKYFNG